jgi:hypothetical protein
MATSPSVLTLAGPPGEDSRRRLLIGVQRLGFEDFGGGVLPAVSRRIEPAIGITPLQRLAAG